MRNNYDYAHLLNGLVIVEGNGYKSYGFEYACKPIFLTDNKKAELQIINNTLEKILNMSDSDRRTELLDEFVLLNFIVIKTYYAWIFKYTSDNVRELFDYSCNEYSENKNHYNR